jgi:hypothetical protein
MVGEDAIDPEIHLAPHRVRVVYGVDVDRETLGVGWRCTASA